MSMTIVFSRLTWFDLGGFCFLKKKKNLQFFPLTLSCLLIKLSNFIQFAKILYCHGQVAYLEC